MRSCGSLVRNPFLNTFHLNSCPDHIIPIFGTLFFKFRSHAGAVEHLAKSSFGDGYTVEPAGGSGYKTLRLVNGTAGKIFY